MDICVNNLTIISSDNGLSPGRRQGIIWTNARVLLIGTSGNYHEFLSEIHTFFFQEIPFVNVVLKKVSILSRPQYVKGVN